MKSEWTKYNIAGAIMAGGSSRRMSGRHKGDLLTAKGQTFTEHLVEEMRQLTDCIYISYGDTVRTQVADCRVVQDIYTGCGPIGGLHAVLLAAAGDGMDGVAVVACDMPFAEADIFRYMYEQLREDRWNAFAKYDGIVAVADDGMHPLTAIYSVKAADVLGEQLKGGIYRLTVALSRLRIFYVDLTGSGLAHMLVNINTKEEYETLVKAGASSVGSRYGSQCYMMKDREEGLTHDAKQ